MNAECAKLRAAGIEHAKHLWVGKSRVCWRKFLHQHRADTRHAKRKKSARSTCQPL